MRKLKKFKIYKNGEHEPLGTIRDICVLSDAQKVEAILMETISLIPISKIVNINDIDFTEDKTIYLKKGCNAKSLGSLGELYPLNDIQNVKTSKNKKNILKDIHFDFETGEITDIVISKNKLSKNTKISINKINIKDNTIYIE